MDLKFFYVVDVNTTNQKNLDLSVVREFVGHTDISLTSKSFENDEVCVNSCKAFLSKLVAKINTEHADKVKLVFSVNPLLFCDETELDKIDCSDFSEHTIAILKIVEKANESNSLFNASVLAYGVEENHNIVSRGLH